MLNQHLKYLKSIHLDFSILYIEDNNKVRKETVKMLKNIMPNITEAENGQIAINLYIEHLTNKNLKEFDLIITDIQMPEQDGLSMIKTIRETNQNIQIIIFTAYSNSEYFLEAIKIGVDGYILKPYNIMEITEVLVNTLKKHEKKSIVPLAFSYIWCTINNTLKKNDLFIKLSQKEIKLVTFLLSAQQSIKASDEIENYIFDDFKSENKRVRSLISRLNNKLDSNIIESIYAEGYRIKTL
jgi:DNA-binding response OmpR family regulator